MQLLPATVKLTIGEKFTYSVDNLPKNLKYLNIGKATVQALDNLPEKLEVLIVSKTFNGEVNRLPKTLKSLTLGLCFNRSINDLPDSIEELILYSNCTEILKKATKLPKSLKLLATSKPLKLKLPINVRLVSIYDEDYAFK